MCRAVYLRTTRFSSHHLIPWYQSGKTPFEYLQSSCDGSYPKEQVKSEPGLNCQECSTFCFTGHYVPPPRYFWWLIFVKAGMSTPSNLALCASPPSSVTQTPSHLTAHCPTKTLEPGDFCPSSTNIDSSGKRRLYPYLSYLC